MNSNFYKIIILLFLSSCTSIIDSTIPLSSEFEKNSEVIILKTPSWRIKDSVFNKRLGEYSVVNTETSSTTIKTRLLDRKEESNFINYLLFGDSLSFINDTFEVNNSSKFSFDFKKNDLLISTSKCEIFSQNLNEKKITKGSDNDNIISNSGHDTRLKTYLICAILHNEILWKLILTSHKENRVNVQLESQNLLYEVTEVSKFISLVEGNNGIEGRNIPSVLSSKAGLDFLYNKKQVAALSFVGNPKIWLRNDLPVNSKELLLTVNYSLTMFNWLDSDWR